MPLTLPLTKSQSELLKIHSQFAWSYKMKLHLLYNSCRPSCLCGVVMSERRSNDYGDTGWFFWSVSQCIDSPDLVLFWNEAAADSVSERNKETYWLLFQGFTGDGRVIALWAASALRQEKGSGHRQQSMLLLHKQSEPGGVFFFFFCKQTQRSHSPQHTHTQHSTHRTEESHYPHYRKCGFINNNSISFNEHCRYIIENKSETGETSSRESWKCLE